ncbi:trigger factor [Rudanella paleaurantiibacter]|uniref:Trigger factor n=1 Tax=Rudanella paleaurantiibacter TaxID=2614655 RepID=A0A7J5TZ25_9BACT|nr:MULTISPECIES: trigger factor [Rudanella]KAB7730325.1 trigger factor [Rudanella paleaurantiibacter]
MDIALDKASETNASLRITLTPDDYKPEVDKKLKQYSKTVALKGFRPGHVPPALIKKMYGKGILVEEINSILGKTVSNYIRENKLQVVGDPVPNREQADAIDWDTQEQFEFSYELGLASDFDVHFDQLPALTQYQIEVTDKEINETIENLQKQFHTHEHADEVADGDTIYGELKQVNAPEGAEAGFASKTAFPTNKMAEEAKADFIGKKKGEVVTFTIETVFPNEKDRANATGVKKEEAADLTGEFTFEIEDVTRHQPAEINQELFDKTFGIGQVESEEQFRTKIAEVISKNYERESSTLLRYDIERELLNNIPILLPEEFLKNWLIESNEGKVSREQVDAEFEEFAKSVKLQLIKNKIAETADVKVEFEEIMEVTRQMVREQFGFTNTDDEEMNKTIDKIARNYLMDEKNNGQNYTSLFNRVFDDKVIEYAKTQVTVESKPASFDEFKAVAEGR